jgi:hypothetical protein
MIHPATTPPVGFADFEGGGAPIRGRGRVRQIENSIALPLMKDALLKKMTSA